MSITSQQSDQKNAVHQVGSDAPFYVALIILGSVYIILIVGMMIAKAGYTTPSTFMRSLADEKIEA